MDGVYGGTEGPRLTMVDISELLQDRGCGFARIAFAKNYDLSLEEVLAGVGLQSGPNDLRAIDSLEAQTILCMLLSKDLAYGSPSTKADSARRHPTEFLAENARPDARIYTNIRQEGDRVVGWNAVSSSSFDGCLLIVNQSFVACLLVEDED